ncbi:hypothetical protein SAMN02910350_01838 [Pseudobutyrivibrio xylanivorans]|jgi:predicted nuclease of restriction endonuclease-like RecB superfamily|uniref:Uncharacterized protein n=2 Tax=Pseudobutyrivibrio xylanivorans TaxID=185007 RepID=A0A1G5RZV8_PSEXY|nr:hypothetical protein SAMN02910350_01838 [Pseudobutyrivibrio xylanivorans]
MVRSKSETFIDIVLCQKNIPFRYEYELKIGNNTFYPDFTIMHPISKEIIYWEHLGKMDNPEYFRKALAKIKVYHDNGIFAGQNLILTFESKTHPFTYNEAEAALVQMNL